MNKTESVNIHFVDDDLQRPYFRIVGKHIVKAHWQEGNLIPVISLFVPLHSAPTPCILWLNYTIIRDYTAF